MNKAAVMFSLLLISIAPADAFAQAASERGRLVPASEVTFMPTLSRCMLAANHDAAAGHSLLTNANSLVLITGSGAGSFCDTWAVNDYDRRSFENARDLERDHAGFAVASPISLHSLEASSDTSSKLEWVGASMEKSGQREANIGVGDRIAAPLQQHSGNAANRVRSRPVQQR